MRRDQNPLRPGGSLSLLLCVPFGSRGLTVMDAPGMEYQHRLTLQNQQPVGRLHVFRRTRYSQTDFLLYPGFNVIGRRSDSAVILPFPFISRQHAIIEIPLGSREPVLYDFGSLNGSSLLSPRRPLYPWVNYPLRDQDMFIIAKVLCQYHYLGPPQLPCPQRALTVEEPFRFHRMDGHRLQAEESNEIKDDSIIHSHASGEGNFERTSGVAPLLGTQPSSMEDEGHLEKDQNVIGKDGNSDSDVEVNEDKDFDQ
ncbi:mediator of DNA damage checkpoint protein 1-like [Macrotis lagotis]|uniref:mediator of DNA damage checkpoint protein 1-like n=1 Tax=Macrotis lagotis TaxID=92651 RepID=UPI003D6908AA